MLVLGSVATASPQPPAAGEAHGPRADEQEIAEVNAVRLAQAEEHSARKRIVTQDRDDGQCGEQDGEERSTDPVRHSQMLVPRRWSDSPVVEDGDANVRLRPWHDRDMAGRTELLILRCSGG